MRGYIGMAISDWVLGLLRIKSDILEEVEMVWSFLQLILNLVKLNLSQLLP